VIALLRLGIASVLVALSLCSIVPAQTGLMWKLSIVASEAGHLIALASLILLLIPAGGNRSVNRGSRLLLVVALIVSVAPVVRAIDAGRTLDHDLSLAFGSTRPRSLPGAPAKTSPLSVTSLFKRDASPDVKVRTLAYAGREDGPLSLDLYTRAVSPSPRPLVVALFPGSWRSGSKKEFPELNRYLAARGYAVAAPDYRLAPKHRFPAQTDDVNAAIDYLIANAAQLGIDSTRIALVGRSAGGQLALQSAYTRHDPRIRGVVARYAPSDQKWGWDHPADRGVYDSFLTLREFIGADPDHAPQAYHDSSPINHIGSHTIPSLIIHGDIDPIVSVVQSRRLSAALARNDVPHLMIDMPWATHGCDYFFTGPCGQISTFAIERFLAAVTDSL
jgi:acetyl esterase/lipase